MNIRALLSALLFLPFPVFADQLPDLNRASAAQIRAIFRRHGWPGKTASILINSRERLGHFEAMGQLPLLKGISRKMGAKLSVVFSLVIPVRQNRQLPLLMQIMKYRSPEERKYKDSAGRRALNINSAAAGKLAALPAMTMVLAKRVISFRKQQGLFSKRWELLKVHGISPDLYAVIRPFICAKKPSRRVQLSLSGRFAAYTASRRGLDYGGNLFIRIKQFSEVSLSYRVRPVFRNGRVYSQWNFLRTSLQFGNSDRETWIRFGDFQIRYHSLIDGELTGRGNISPQKSANLFTLRKAGYSWYDPPLFGVSASISSGILHGMCYFSSYNLKEMFHKIQEKDTSFISSFLDSSSGGCALKIRASDSCTIHLASLVFEKVNAPFTALQQFGLQLSGTKTAMALSFFHLAGFKTDRVDHSLAASSLVRFTHELFTLRCFVYLSAKGFSPPVLSSWGEQTLPGSGIQLSLKLRPGRLLAAEASFTRLNRLAEQIVRSRIACSISLRPLSSVVIATRWKHENKGAPLAEFSARNSFRFWLQGRIFKLFHIHTGYRICLPGQRTVTCITALVKTTGRHGFILRADAGTPADDPIYIPASAVGHWYTGGKLYYARFRSLLLGLFSRPTDFIRLDLRVIRRLVSGKKAELCLHLNSSLRL